MTRCRTSDLESNRHPLERPAARAAIQASFVSTMVVDNMSTLVVDINCSSYLHCDVDLQNSHKVATNWVNFAENPRQELSKGLVAAFAHCSMDRIATPAAATHMLV